MALRRITIQEAKELEWIWSEEHVLSAPAFAKFCGIDKSVLYKAIKAGEVEVMTDEDKEEYSIPQSKEIYISMLRDKNSLFIYDKWSNLTDRLVQIASHDKGCPVYDKGYLAFRKVYLDVIGEVQRINKSRAERN